MFDGAPSTYTFQREVFAEVIDEARPMLERQWLEAGEIGVGALKLSEERYIAADKAGVLWTVTVRYRGELIGYATAFVVTGMHADAKAVVSDALYLLPPHRRPGVSMRLVKYVEGLANEKGAELVHWGCNSRFPGFGRLLEFLGYSAVSTTYAKVLAHA